MVSIKVKEVGQSSSYAEVLKKARERISLKDLGIKDPKVRLAANEGILVEVPGPDGLARADVEKLKQTTSDEINVYRPIKFGEVKISGVDLSVGSEDLLGLSQQWANVPWTKSDLVHLEGLSEYNPYGLAAL